MKQDNQNVDLRMLQQKKNFSGHFPFAFVCLLAIIFFVRHLLVFDRGLEFIASQVTIDDTYYYLNTAWNQKHLGFTTFDGVNQTNGVQFAWYWILVAFSYLFETRDSFLHGSLVLCATLSVLSIFLGYRLGKVLGMGWTSVVPSVAIAVLVGYNKTLIVGLENTLHLAFFLLLVIEYCKFLQNLTDSKLSSRYYLRITCLLGLITWARLDNAPISAILYIYTTFEFYRANRNQPELFLRKIVLSAVIISLSAVTMFYGFYRMGGSIVPVSGLWKVRPPEEQNLLAVFVEAWQDGLQRVFPLEHLLSERLREVLALILPASFLIILMIRYRSGGNNKPLLRGLCIILLSIVLHEMMMVYRLPYLTIRRGFWYLSPEFVLMVIIISLMIHWLPEMLVSKKARFRQQLVVSAACLFIINAFVFSAYTNNWYLTNSSYDKFHAQRIETALWLKKNFPSDIRFGALNSGELGFFSQRSVTNLDGLINSYEYFKFRKNGGGVAEFCKLQGIDYFIDHFVPDDIKENSKLVETFRSKPIIQLVQLVKHEKSAGVK